MQDSLEQFIIAHKQDFDVLETDDRLWQRIDQELHRAPDAKQIPFWAKTWKYAASIVALVGLAGFLLWQYGPTAKPCTEPAMTEAPTLFPEELTEVESYYASMISSQIALISDYRKEGVSIDADMMAQIDELNRSYNELKDELLRTEDKELIVREMIKNRTLQLDLLNQQLIILERIKELKYGDQILS
ncbi:MAG: hypothetical protein AAF206_25175 [Bacteroidota bacterium]